MPIAKGSSWTLSFERPSSGGDGGLMSLQQVMAADDPVNSPDPGPTHPVILCSQGNYFFTDANGTFNLRNNCPYSNMNWGFNLSVGLLAISAGLCSESGLNWNVNGVKVGKNAPHAGVSCHYIFHGTIPGVHNADTVSYFDDIYFPVKGGGKAHVHFSGIVIASSR